MTTTHTTAGPLVVSTKNPRYFTTTAGDLAGRAVYLTGSHIWNNLHDGMGPGPDGPTDPERFDFEAYLRFLTERNHNFIRLWRWEQFRSKAAGGAYHLNMAPQPWSRTGGGEAKDGEPKFDLSRHDPEFFSRLRDRVEKANLAGIYVAVMLFEGWALHLSPPPDHIEGHPFHAANNVNDIAATSINDLQVLPLEPRVEEIQDAYVRAVVDTLHDLPNVLWEVSNESTGDGSVTQEFADFLGIASPPTWGDSTAWQYRVIDTVEQHERDRGYQPHPIGMTMQFPVADQRRVNDPLHHSRAHWISPGYDDEIFTDGAHPMAPGSPASRWLADPPAADGRKVIIADTDHFAPGDADPLWPWKAFLRGHHPILMDYGLIAGLEPGGDASADAGVPPFEHYESTRLAMGDTARWARRIDLVNMEPHDGTASTGYALANPGVEYLVLEPTGGGEAFTVQLTPGQYSVEWFNVTSGAVASVESLDVTAEGPVAVVAPWPNEPTVLYLTARCTAGGDHG